MKEYHYFRHCSICGIEYGSDYEKDNGICVTCERLMVSRKISEAIKRRKQREMEEKEDES